MRNDDSDRVEFLSIDEQDALDSPFGTIRVAPIVVIMAVVGVVFLNLARAGGDGQPVEPAPERSVPSSVAPDEPPAVVGGDPPDLLVRSTSEGLVVVSVDDGRFKIIDLDSPPVDVVDAGGSRVFVLGGDRAVRLVDSTTGASEPFASSIDVFVPSASPGRVWTRSSGGPGEVVETDADGNRFNAVGRPDVPRSDPRLWVDGDGALYLLGDGVEPTGIGPSHRVLDTTNADVFAEACEGDDCEIKRRSLSDPGEQWEPIGPSPPSFPSVSVSSDGRWLVAIDDTVIALYRTDIGGIRKAFTGGSAALFAPDSNALYVIDDTSVQVVDLVGDDLNRVKLPPLPEATGEWIALAP